MRRKAFGPLCDRIPLGCSDQGGAGDVLREGTDFEPADLSRKIIQVALSMYPQEPLNQPPAEHGIDVWRA